MKGLNYDRADLKWSMLLELQSSPDKGRYHECILLYRQQISVVVKEGGDIFHLGSNKISEFTTILKFLHVLE